jgi:serine protease inhibitor
VQFWVDRPFLVLVRHEPSGALYFLARVTQP